MHLPILALSSSLPSSDRHLLPPSLLLFFSFSSTTPSTARITRTISIGAERSAARPKLRSPQLPAPSQVLIFRGDNEDPRARTASSRPSRLLNFPSRNRGGPRGPPLLFRRDEKFMRRDQILMLGRNEFSNFRRASSPPLSFAPLPPRLPFLRLSFASIAYHRADGEGAKRRSTGDLREGERNNFENRAIREN